MRLMRLMRPMRKVGARRSGPAVHALADRGADRRALTADSQRPMSLAACLLFTFLVYDHLIQYQGHAQTVMALVAGSLAVFFGLARLAAQVPRFRRRMQEHAYEVALLFCLVISLDAIIGLVATGQPWETGSGGRGEFHPPAPTEPCVTVSRHTGRVAGGSFTPRLPRNRA